MNQGPTDLRGFIREVENRGLLEQVPRPVSPDLEVARILAAEDGAPVLFRSVEGYPGYRMVGGIGSDRRYYALALGVPPDRLLFRLREALATPVPPPVDSGAPWMEVEEPAVDLLRVPFLRHWPGDGGYYATASVVFLRVPGNGYENVSFHRLLRLDSTHLVARLVEGRGAHTAWTRSKGDVPVAIAIGLPPHILLAASMSPPEGVFEMHLAQAMAPTPLVEAPLTGLLVPAAAEIVLEGRITHNMATEGPFVDLTGTMDIVRQQPIVEIDRIYHRRDPIYQALLPGMREHRLLMGMPREPTICDEVSKECRCLNVYVTPGGASWLHAVVQIEKRSPDDGIAAGIAAFRGHQSLKHVVVVDDDVDIFSPEDVEWAVATRFQANRDLRVMPDMPSSSLDPSAHHHPGTKSTGAKMILDATVPWDTPTGPAHPEAFRRVIGTSGRAPLLS